MCSVKGTKLYGLRIKKNQLIVKERDKNLFLNGSWGSYLRPELPL